MSRRDRSIHPFAGVAALAISAAIAGCSAGTPAGASTAPSAAAAPAAAVTTPAPSTSSDLLADIDIGGGRTMHILCVGPIVAGEPTVIFESGLGGDAGQFSDVIHELGGSVRACAYDRAGAGQSPAATVGRTTKEQVADLRALLAAAKVPPPYLLVGYSVGGWNVMVHADQHPEEVVGAVMAEVRPPALSQEWAKMLPPESATEPEGIKGAREEFTIFETDPTLNPEGLKLGASAAEAIAAADLGAKPLIVLVSADTAGISEGLDAALGAKFVDTWWKLQNDLAELSTAGRLEKVTGATHEIIFERPDAVADAIREALAD